MNTPQAYPLQWPANFPRHTGSRENAKFRTELGSALRNLQKQLDLMGAKGLVLSSNCTLGKSNHEDPGVCAYFQYDGMQLAIPCDRWNKVASNVQAIALTVEAMRGMNRWGAKHMIRAMFTGFKALPAGGTQKRNFRAVLNLFENDTLLEAERQFRQLAQSRHPDHGGSNEAMAELNEAIAEARRALR